MPAPFLHTVSSYDELWSQVDYKTMAIPEHFNLGVAFLDDQDPDAVALTLVAGGRLHRSYTFGEVKEQARTAWPTCSPGWAIGKGDVVGLVKAASLETAQSPTWPSSAWGRWPCPCRRCSGPTRWAFRLRHGGAKAVLTSIEGTPPRCGKRGRRGRRRHHGHRR